LNRDNFTISLDAMGGDNCPVNEIKAAVDALGLIDNLRIKLNGPADLLNRELKNYSYDTARLNVNDSKDVIRMDEVPTEALKLKPDSSIANGLRLVKNGEADAFISAGNTGAVMAASLLILGRIVNVSRPSIGSVFPTENGITFLLDVGANVDCKPMHLLEFGVMGSVYVNHIYGIDKPTVGLLSVGEEKSKGNQLTGEAYELLEKSGLNFVGNVEGRDILKGNTNVIICDGFTGNIILKFAESVPGILKAKFSAFANRNILNKLKVASAYGTLRTIMKDFDYQEYGGVPLLGVNGISVIGHGRSTPKAFVTMIRKAMQMYNSNLIKAIESKIKDIKEFYNYSGYEKN
jgi:glycerol-3-phosphate acyltransferase PlsX